MGSLDEDQGPGMPDEEMPMIRISFDWIIGWLRAMEELRERREKIE